VRVRESAKGPLKRSGQERVTNKAFNKN